MGKVIKKVLPIVVGVGLMFIGGPAGALFRSLGLGLALTGVAGLLRKKPKQYEQEHGQQLRLQVNPTAPRQILYGSSGTGGTLVYREATGQDNKNLWLVIALAGHEVEAISSMKWGDEHLQFSGATVSGNYAGNINIFKHLGSDSQAADTALLNQSTYWTTSHRLRGVSYVVMQLVYDAEKFRLGVQNTTFYMKGRKVYDPRKDSTNGGSGSHRLNNESTWEYSSNPALCIADYLMGIKVGGTVVAGMGIDPDRIDWDCFIAEANICDETVSKKVGSEKRYTCNGWITPTSSHRDNLEALASSMGGTVVFQGGKWRCYAAAARPAVKVRNSAHVLGPVSMRAKQSHASKVNCVRGGYADATDEYKARDYPPIRNASYIAADGGKELWLDLSLPMTTSPTMAQRLSKIALERARREMTCALTFNPVALQDQAMDAISFTHTPFNLSNKKMLVADWSLRFAADDEGRMAFMVEEQLVEEDDAIYAWNASTEEQNIGSRTNIPALGRDLPDMGEISGNLPYDRVSGANKPEDNATVGAPYGTYVAGTPSDVLVLEAASGKAIFQDLTGSVNWDAIAKNIIYQNGGRIDDFKPAEINATRGAPSGTFVGGTSADTLVVNALAGKNISDDLAGSINWDQSTKKVTYNGGGYLDDFKPAEINATRGTPVGTSVGYKPANNVSNDPMNYVMSPEISTPAYRAFGPEDAAFDIVNGENKTIEFWVSVFSRDIGNSQFIAGKTGSTTSGGWYLVYDGSGAQSETFAFRLNHNVEPDTIIVGADTVPRHEWAHIAIVHKSNNDIELYLNGAFQDSASSTESYPATSQPLTLFGISRGDARGCHAAIRDVRVWSKAKTASEIQDDMSKILEGSESNLLAWYPLHEGEGRESLDYTGSHDPLSLDTELRWRGPNSDSLAQANPKQFINDPSFEDGLEWWHVSIPGTVTAKTDGGNSDSGYLQFSYDSNTYLRNYDVTGKLKKFPCKVGDKIEYGCWFKVVAGPGYARCAILFYDKDGAQVGTDVSANTSSSSWTESKNVETVPSNTAYFQLRIQLFGNGSTSVIDIDDVFFRLFEQGNAAPSGTRIGGGTFVDDIEAGAGRALIAFDISSRLDGLNRMPMLRAGGPGTGRANNPLTASDAGASATISIGSHTTYFGTSSGVNYGSGSLAGLSFSSDYRIYKGDEYFNGGGVYHYTSAPEDVGKGRNRYWVGDIKTPSNGGGSTGGGGGGGGAGGGSGTILF